MIGNKPLAEVIRAERSKEAQTSRGGNTGHLACGLCYAESADVRVVLYADDSGTVQIRRDGEWTVVRPGDVLSKTLIIELTIAAMRFRHGI